MNGLKEFKFNLPRALKAELISLLDGMEAGPLQPEVTAQAPEARASINCSTETRSFMSTRPTRKQACARG